MENTLATALPEMVYYTSSARSESISELAKALATAQGAWGSAPKNKTNPHLKSQYADLASIWDTVRGPLSANGLALVQVVETDKSEITCYSELLHTSGQWIRGKLTLHAPAADVQKIGAAITYAKRYAMSALLGVASDEEDDGESQTQPAPKEKKFKQISTSEDGKSVPKADTKTQASPPAQAQTAQPAQARSSLEDDKNKFWAMARDMRPVNTKEFVQELMGPSFSLKNCTGAELAVAWKKLQEKACEEVPF